MPSKGLFNVDNSKPVILSICSGVGMLDQAVELVLPQARVACYAEWDSFASSILLARMEESALEPAPVWCGDLGGFDARPFSGVVDILTAGLPCQPYSLAGKRNGNSDHRSFGNGDGPLEDTLRIISECRPAMAFFENVPTWIRGGWFRQFGEQLCGLGYEISSPVFVSAGDIGASHERERVFILADSMRQRREESRIWRKFSETFPEREAQWHNFDGGGENIFAPGKNSDEWERILRDSPHFAPEVEPNVRCMVNGDAILVDESRQDQLRSIGNSVVALQAALAFAILLESL
jgi:site-specific DNA-cytosine methylase